MGAGSALELLVGKTIWILWEWGPGVGFALELLVGKTIWISVGAGAGGVAGASGLVLGRGLEAVLSSQCFEPVPARAGAAAAKCRDEARYPNPISDG